MRSVGGQSFPATGAKIRQHVIKTKCQNRLLVQNVKQCNYHGFSLLHSSLFTTLIGKGDARKTYVNAIDIISHGDTVKGENKLHTETPSPGNRTLDLLAVR